jgi:hypothetical protein
MSSVLADAASLPPADPRLVGVAALAASDRCEHRATFEHEAGGGPVAGITAADGDVVDEDTVSGDWVDTLVERVGRTGPVYVSGHPLAARLTEHYGPLDTGGDPFVLVGVADTVVYREGRPAAVVARSFVDRTGDRPAPERATRADRFRPWLCALALDHAGFDVHGLDLVTLKHDGSLREDHDHLEAAVRRAVEGGHGTPVPTEFGPDGVAVMGPDAGTIAFEERYDRTAYQPFLTDVLSYWRGERPARGPPTPHECSGCRFHGTCDHALR